LFLQVTTTSWALATPAPCRSGGNAAGDAPHASQDCRHAQALVDEAQRLHLRLRETARPPGHHRPSRPPLRPHLPI